MKDKKPSIRKGCKWCTGPLITFKEKVLRTCDDCARKALDAGTSFSKGKINEGKDAMVNIMFGRTGLDKEDIKRKTEAVLNKKQKTIVQMAKKKGISEADAIAAIKQLKA